MPISGGSNGYGASSIATPVQMSHRINCAAASSNSKEAYLVQFKNNNEFMLMPDYNDIQNKEWDIKHTANCNGWLYACISSITSNSYIQINGSKNLKFSLTNNNSYSYFGTIFIPLSQGDSYFAYKYGKPMSLFFIPGKKGKQTGFPDWNQEKPQEWNKNITATEPGWIYATCISYSCDSQGAGYSPGILKVNGANFVISQAGNDYMNSSLLLPISKDDKYCANGGNSGQSISFFPFLKNP